MTASAKDEGHGIELTREPGCCGELAWRLDLSPDRDFSAVARGLIDRGYEGRCLSQMLKVLRHPQGHEVVLVPRTGRVQLRVYYLTAHEDRPVAAEAMFRDLVAALTPAGAEEDSPSTT
jgi:hypothetical protein